MDACGGRFGDNKELIVSVEIIGLDSGGGASVPLGMGEERMGVMFLVADDVVSMIGEMCVM